MSIILKGIDMPKKGDFKVFELHSDGTISEYVVTENHSIVGKVYEAIQIDRPHGRLIDEKELKSIKSIQSADFNSIETIQKWIDNAPTILESEE